MERKQDAVISLGAGPQQLPLVDHAVIHGALRRQGLGQLLENGAHGLTAAG